MWNLKKKWFTSVGKMIIVTPSDWLANLVKQSYLKKYDVVVVNNGIDTTIFKFTKSDFKEKMKLENFNIVLGVANVWDNRKGLSDFLKLSKILNDNYKIILVGLSKSQIETLPTNIIGIERTNSSKELAMIYSSADVFVNPTYEDNYPTTNLEARACNLPIVTYDVGGSPESAGKEAIVVECGNIEELKDAIISICNKKEKNLLASNLLDNRNAYSKYLEIYKSLINQKI